MHRRSLLSACLALVLLLTGCSGSSDDEASLTIYSGRSESFISPFLTAFEKESGIKLDIRYADSSSLAAQILEEGANSPADLFLSQDAGSLGAVSRAGLFAQLPEALLGKVSSNYRSASGDWVGVTGRVRVLAYSPKRVGELPGGIDDLTSPTWRGRIGIAPASSYFQSFLTALIAIRGEAGAQRWLEALKANEPKYYDKDGQIIEGIDAGEVDLGLVNHYYVWEVSEELGRAIDVKIELFRAGDAGNLVNVSGAGILRSSSKSDSAAKLIEFLLSERSQRSFVADVHEYSLLLPELGPPDLPTLAAIPGPKVNLSQLADVKKAQELLFRVGLI